MPRIPVRPAVLAEVRRQLNHELGAAHAYEALAWWCIDRNLKGFARFFLKQAGEEREHARRFTDHLLDRGELPLLTALPAPRNEFDSLAQAAEHARQMEQLNTAGIHAAYEAAVRERDYAAQVLLQWFINEQVEEEAWADEMVERVERANCAGGLGELDRHIERHLTDDVDAPGGED